MFNNRPKRISKKDQIKILQSNFEICNKRKQETDAENIKLQDEIKYLTNEVDENKLALMSQEDYVLRLEDINKTQKKEISNLKRKLTNLEKEMNNKIITELGLTKGEIDELMFGENIKNTKKDKKVK